MKYVESPEKKIQTLSFIRIQISGVGEIEQWLRILVDPLTNSRPGFSSHHSQPPVTPISGDPSLS